MTQGDTFPPGTPLLDGRFVITGVIANGGQAVTYEGMDKLGGERVAIKRFSVRGASSWKEVELAEREARVLSGLRHVALPKVIAHFEEQGALYLVLEYVEGSTLEQLRATHQLEQEDVIAYLTKISEILHYLHSQSPPIVHRDIKPRNLIRRPDGRFVLVDFGSVRDRLRPEGGSTVVGTFGYMAPEQFQGRATPASDTYGAAATALTLLSGRDPDQLPHQGLRLDVEASLGSSVSPEIKRLLNACLDPNPDTRPASLRDALTKYPLRRVNSYTAASGATSARTESASSNRTGAGPYNTWYGPEAHTYADLGDAPFHTPGYQRDRVPKNRRQRRHERREQKREGRREQRAQRRQEQYYYRGRSNSSHSDIDVERPLSQALRIPEVRRALRIPVVGLIVFVLLMVLRTALWVVLGVVLPRLLYVLQRVTGSRLGDTVQQSSAVGGSLRDQLTRVADQVRDGRREQAVEDNAQRFRVATPVPSKFDEIADNLQKKVAEFEEDLESGARDWDHRTRK